MRDLVPYSVCISAVDQDYWELVNQQVKLNYIIQIHKGKIFEISNVGISTHVV